MGVKSVKASDHNLLILELNIKWNSLNESSPRQEIFNFKHEECFQRFEMLTESNNDLVNCFDECSDLNMAANKWIKILNNLIQKSFKKIRIRKQKMDPVLSKLFDEKEQLRSKISDMENRDDVCDFLDELLAVELEYEEVLDKIELFLLTRTKNLLMIILEEQKTIWRAITKLKLGH